MIDTRRIFRSIRYRLGMHVVAPGLEDGTDAGVHAHYNSRLSECSFLADPTHYERPRIDWILGRVHGGSLLEIGSADGTVSALLAPRVERLVAVDVCEESVRRVLARGLPNVEARQGLIERIDQTEQFDWVVMSEVLEHLRDPRGVLARVLTWLRPGGAVLLSSPDGTWEGDSIEHLHEFDLESWCQLIVRAGGRNFRVFRIADSAKRDRWLAAEVGGE
jgi:2-polyprenyl-3-methyl-5-hydroxy-6-metoxy-1,4-benzoquinol methylase